VPTEDLMTHALDLLVDGLAFPECPRWHDGRLFVSEKRAGRVVALSSDGAVSTVIEVPGGPGGLGWTPAGELLVLDMAARRLLRLVDGALELAADLAALTVGRCNDMVVDASGRAYVGHFGYDLLGGAKPAPASLVLAGPDGTTRTVAEELAFPNGCAITPDGGTLLVAESAGGRITQFRITDDGSLVQRSIFAQLDGIVPDGIVLDAEACLWVSDPIAGAVVRVRPGGEVIERIDTSPAGAFACELGGADGRTLFICLYSEEASQMAQGAPATGSIVTTTVDVPAAPRPRPRPQPRS